MITTLALAVACSDYEIINYNDANARYNPPVLEAETKQDVVVQVTVPAVDVLWVIDNSCSMIEEQQALTDNFSDFMEYFVDSGLDFHVGVVSTDMDSAQHQGRLRPDGSSGLYIDNTFTRDEAIESFRSRAYMGTNGSASEAGLDAAWTALVELSNSYNAGFYRPDAGLSIVVISDEDDQSRHPSLSEFISWMLTVKAEPAVATFSSIVGPDRGCATADAGTTYLEVTRQVGGIEWSICDSDWSTVLTELGLQAAGLKREFFLSSLPVEDTIVVSVLEPDGDLIDFERDADWTYSRSRNSVTFLQYVPEPLADVLVDYEVFSSAVDPVEETGGTAP